MSEALDARNPAVNSSESPGRKKPNSRPDPRRRSRTGSHTPTSPMSDLGSRRLPAANTRPSIDPGQRPHPRAEPVRRSAVDEALSGARRAGRGCPPGSPGRVHCGTGRLVVPRWRRRRHPSASTSRSGCHAHRPASRRQGLGPAIGVVLPPLAAAVGRHVEQAEESGGRLVAPTGRRVGENTVPVAQGKQAHVPHLPADRRAHAPHGVPGLGVPHELDVGSHLVPRGPRGQHRERDAPGVEVGGVLRVPGPVVQPHCPRAAFRRTTCEVDHELVAPWNRSRIVTGPSTPTTSTAPSISTIGSRRRAAAMASPSRVWAFSRTREPRPGRPATWPGRR